MKKIRICFLMLFLFGAYTNAICQKQVDVVKFDWYKKLRSQDNDTTYIVNFWATWCLPCVEELPEFEKIHTKYSNAKVKVILVSLDSYIKLNITLIPYLEKTKIQSEVVLLNEPDYNSWINKVDKHWEGSIPATVIFNKQKKYYHFIEKETSYDELNTIIQSIQK